MKKIFLILFILLFCLALRPTGFHIVKFVYDGDTILLENGVKVRYLGIDAPEVDHDKGHSDFMALDAWKYNRKLVKGKQVRFETDIEEKDKYGRVLAYVYLKNGKMVNDLMIQKGMAHVMVSSKELKYRDLFIKSQQKAMKDRLGIWRENPEKREKVYYGHKRSFRFHRPDCPSGKKISIKNRILFKKRDDAFYQGYSPCRHCRP